MIVAPLVAKEFQVGLIEVINKRDGTPFLEDDLFLLNSIAETAASALNNAGLLQAERKVEILETLVKVSAEITSTLDLDRVLDAIVTGPGAVIPYERAAIALEQRGRLKIRAVTGIPRINPQDPNIVRLQDILEWASLSNTEVFFSQHGEEFEDPRQETQAKFSKYFADSGMRGFYAVPLADDDGRVGTLSFESSDPDFLGPVHLEMIKILSAQATVALRREDLDHFQVHGAQKIRIAALKRQRANPAIVVGKWHGIKPAHAGVREILAELCLSLLAGISNSSPCCEKKTSVFDNDAHSRMSCSRTMFGSWGLIRGIPVTARIQPAALLQGNRRSLIWNYRPGPSDDCVQHSIQVEG